MNFWLILKSDIYCNSHKPQIMTLITTFTWDKVFLEGGLVFHVRSRRFGFFFTLINEIIVYILYIFLNPEVWRICKKTKIKMGSYFFKPLNKSQICLKSLWRSWVGIIFMKNPRKVILFIFTQCYNWEKHFNTHPDSHPDSPSPHCLLVPQLYEQYIYMTINTIT